MARSSTKKKHRRGARTASALSWPVLVAAIGMVAVLAGAIIWFFSNNQAGASSDFVPEVSGAPRLEVSEELVDYGDVRLNTNIETVFRVRNVGDRPLQILGEPQVELVQGC